MPTFEPPIDLLKRQVESISAQTEAQFTCIVSDDASSEPTYAEILRVCSSDARFLVSQSERRQGFRANFERALSLVPPGVEYVAMSDRDEVWYPEKLEVLIEALCEPDVLLAYGDMRIVGLDGTPIAHTYWNDRRNNFTNLGSLLLVNTVTGAASLFRRELLEEALPFPVVPGFAHHDHWIASFALARGRISFVPRPLHDHVQHGASMSKHGVNVVGRHEPLPSGLKGGLVHALGRFLRKPGLRLRNTARYARRHFEDDVVPRRLLAQELEQRLGGDCPRAKRRVIRRVARLGSPGSLVWLLGRSARDVRGDSETFGLENQLIKGIVWSWLRWSQATAGTPPAGRSAWSPRPQSASPDDEPLVVSLEGVGVLHLAPWDLLISDVIRRTGMWEPHITTFLRRIVGEGTLFVDVGANIGYFTVLGARLVGPTGRVVAFEPAPLNVQLLFRSVLANGFDHVDVWPLALSDRMAVVGLHTGDWHTNSALAAAAEVTSDTTRVVALPGGTVLGSVDHDGPCVMKLDVEGHEHAALIGLEEFLVARRPTVVLEFSPLLIRNMGGDADDLLAWLFDRFPYVGWIDPTGAVQPLPSPSAVLGRWRANYDVGGPEHALHLDLVVTHRL